MAVEPSLRPAAATAGLGAALVICAGLLDAEPLYVPGIAFLVLALGAMAWVLVGARGLAISRTVAERRVMEGQPVRVEIAVTAARPLPAGLLLEPLLADPAPLAVGRRTTHVRIDARFGRRGRRVLAAPRVAVRDPLGLATRVVGGGDDAELLILPRVEPVRAEPEAADGGVLGRRQGRPSVAAEVEIDGLRPYREGTPAARIVWPVFARSGELYERVLRADSDTRPLVILDPRGRIQDDVDAAVRAAVSLCVALARAGGCALLVPGDRRATPVDPTLAGWPHLHARLALVTAASVPSLAGISGRSGPVVYVAGRRLTRPPRVLAHAPGGGRILVVPSPIAGRRALFTVAGCHGYELSDVRLRVEAA